MIFVLSVCAESSISSLHLDRFLVGDKFYHRLFQLELMLRIEILLTVFSWGRRFGISYALSDTLESQFFIAKLDMEKSYDRVRWSHWIWHASRMLWCYATWRGFYSQPFYPTNGPRQGDLLAPILSVLLADALSLSIRNAFKSNELQGSHALFADDIDFQEM